MTLGLCISPRELGRSLLHSKNRYVDLNPGIELCSFWWQFWEIKQNHYDTVSLLLNIARRPFLIYSNRYCFSKKGQFLDPCGSWSITDDSVSPENSLRLVPLL